MKYWCLLVELNIKCKNNFSDIKNSKFQICNPIQNLKFLKINSKIKLVIQKFKLKISKFWISWSRVCPNNVHLYPSTSFLSSQTTQKNNVPIAICVFTPKQIPFSLLSSNYFYQSSYLNKIYFLLLTINILAHKLL